VLKTKPLKKIPETEAIFEQIEQINTEAEHDPHTLRIFIDAKVAVKIGEFDRGGKTRMLTTSLFTMYSNYFVTRLHQKLGRTNLI